MKSRIFLLFFFFTQVILRAQDFHFSQISADIDKLETEAIEMQKLRFGVTGDYFQKRQELIKPIQDNIFEAMQKVASKKTYAFVFDKANQSNLIFADSKFDISNEVLKEMGYTTK